MPSAIADRQPHEPTFPAPRAFRGAAASSSVATGRAPTSSQTMATLSPTLRASGHFGIFQMPGGPGGGLLPASSIWVGLDGQRRYFDLTLPQIGTRQEFDGWG